MHGRLGYPSSERRARIVAGRLLLFCALVCVSCSGGLQGNGGGGGSGSPGTPTAAYNITVTATSGAVVHSAQVSLTVTP